MKKTIISMLCLLTLSFPLFAQKAKNDAKKEDTKKEGAKKDDKWDVNVPHGKSKEVTFSVTTGTWLNLDVSPDGKEIAFDLLGDIYLMPITGGDAKCIAEGLAYEVQPRFSPDGKKIAFASDRGGADNIWYMNRDGSDKKQITKEDFRLMNNPVWTKDGQYIIARKHFTNTRSLGAGEMWMYHITGGAGIQLTKKKNDQMDTGEPCLSPDNQYLYYSEDASPGNAFEYNKDPNGQIYVVKRYNMNTGEIDQVAGGSGGACRPQVSPDGKKLAFVKRVRFQSVLYIQDLETEEEYPLFRGLSRDQQETWTLFGVYPNYNWTPDGKNIIIYGLGQFHKVDAETGTFTEIPFKANVKQTIMEAANYEQTAFADNFDAKMIRSAVTSPDGKKLVFNAVGHIYLKDLPNGKPQRLTNEDNFEFDPSFSKSGNEIVYTTWDDEAKSSIKILNINTPNATPRTLTKEKGFYHTPSFGSNDKEIVYVKGGGTNLLGFTYSKETGIYKMNLANGEMKRISKDGANPVLSQDGKKLYYVIDPGMNKSYKCKNLETNEDRTVFTSKYATDFTISPDENWVAFTDLYQCYVAALPKTGQAIELNSGTNTLPLKKITTAAGTSLHWAGDAKSLHWVLGPRYYTQSLGNTFSFVENKADSLLSKDTVGIDIGLKLKADVPEGKIAFTNARIITMEGEQVIERGYVLVEKNKISKIQNGDGTFGSDVKVIDCQGKTIIPGLVDVHAHIGVNYNGISPKRSWNYYANLAYGVTTTHDPSNNTEMVFSQHEMVETGEMVGPRIFSTGTILYGADGDFKAVINNLEDARNHLKRLKAVGAFSVKSYNQPRREQRQQVMQAANELKMHVYPEGGSTFFHNMTQVVDGHTGIEHSIPISQVYEDVVKLWGATKVGYTPTLIVGYGGIWGENYWYDKTNVWENKKLVSFTPRAIIDQRSRRRTKAPDEEYGHLQNTQSCTAIAKGGTKVNLGAHGQLQGLGAHWELWMLAQGGMSNLDALKCGTINGANYIGMGNALGSLKEGKLADMLILDANPLEDIKNSEKITYIMKNGRLYEGNTMNEVGNYDKKRGAFYFENGKMSENFEWHEETHSFEGGRCSCFH